MSILPSSPVLSPASSVLVSLLLPDPLKPVWTPSDLAMVVSQPQDRGHIGPWRSKLQTFTVSGTPRIMWRGYFWTGRGEQEQEAKTERRKGVGTEC